MNPQLGLTLPIPIVEEIISLSAFDTKLIFRITCKRFLFFTTKHFFPTFTVNLCDTTKEYHNGDPFFGALDVSSNSLFISDCNNHVIQKIDLLTNHATILCGTLGESGWNDGPMHEAQFCYPSGLALNEREKILYVSDSRNYVIRSINLIDGKVDTIAGRKGENGRQDGIGNNSTFDWPRGLALDSISDSLYVTDCANHSIRRIFLKERRVETLCGNAGDGYKDGSFGEAMFDHPVDIVWNPKMRELYVSDTWNCEIRILSLENKIVSTLCETPRESGHENENRNQATFHCPMGLGLDVCSQHLYVSDSGDCVIKKIPLLERRKVSIFCGTQGKGGSRNGVFPTFSDPKGIVVDPPSQTIYIMDSYNVRKIVDRKKVLSESEFSSSSKKSCK